MAIFRRKYSQPGAAPGTITRGTGGQDSRVVCVEFNPERIQVRDLSDPQRALDFVAPDAVTWFQVIGLGQGEVIETLGRTLGIHHLAISDMHHIGQRPKVESYDNGQFIVLRHLYQKGEDLTEWQQISMFVSERWVLTVEELPSDILTPVLQRLEQGRPTIRAGGSSYLMAALIDATVDAYFPILDTWGQALERLEDRVLSGQSDHLLQELYRMRRNLATLHRAAMPMRTALDRLVTDESLPFPSATRLLLRDALDHTHQIVDVDGSYRDLSTNLIDVHLSLLGQRTNETMQLLTVIATVFIPLTFFAGIYGMNFDTQHPWNMPELRSPYGYPIFLGICGLIGLALFYVFFRLGWLGKKRDAA